MMFRPKIYKSSVAARTTILIVGMVTLILLTSGIWQMQHVRANISDEVHRQAGRSMESAIKVVDNRISNVETAVETAASYADIFAVDYKDCYTLLKRLLQFNEDIDAVTLMYRANFFAQHGRYYAPTVFRNPETGQIFEDEIGGPEHGFDYLENDSNWVYSNKLDDGYWSLPYLDSISTHRAMVSYSVPLHDSRGAVYAVLCADVGLEWVNQMVEDSKPYPYADVTVLSRDSQYVCHPNEQWVQTVNALSQARLVNNDGYLRLTEHMLSGQKGVDTIDKVVSYLNSKETNGDNSRALVYYAPVERVKWSVCYSIPEDKIMERPDRLRVIMLSGLVFILLAISLLLYYIITYQLRPLKRLTESASEVAKGNFHTQLPPIKTQDEIRRLRDAFEDMQLSLDKYMEELKTTTASKASMESELRIASGIQKAMIPKDFPAYPERDDIDVYGQLMPAREVGGDLFDFYIRDEKLFFCIGDVSGKGVPASLLMAVTRSQFRTLSAHEAHPERIVSTINEAIALNNTTNMFVTLLVGVLDLPTGRLRYCNAGHNAPLLIGYNIGWLPYASNIPVGIQPDWKFHPQETTIDPYTNIFLYTDGLTEAENSDHALFGEARIKEVAQQLEDRKPETVLRQMTDAVHAFVGDALQSDDLTMLSIQYTMQKYEARYQHSITLPNDIQTVPQLNVFVDEVCEAMSFDMTTTMQMNLAIEEAVVNVMNYAYPQGVKGDVHIEASANNKRLKVVIRDNGIPFDPTAKAEADTTLSAEDRPIGGLGIHLVRQLMDSINYERVDGYNVLTLRKTLKAND